MKPISKTFTEEIFIYRKRFCFFLSKRSREKETLIRFNIFKGQVGFGGL